MSATAEDIDVLALEIGDPDHLTTQHARTVMKAMQAAAKRNPNMKVIWFVSGYDDDPRELWDIAEVSSHIRNCAREAGITSIRRIPPTFDETTISLMILAGCFR